MPGPLPLACKPFSETTLKSLLVRALENAWDTSTRCVYQSHLKSYIRFIYMHKISLEPNPYTLSLYIVYMSEHIKPSSVESYLTGICHYLAPDYPKVNEWRMDPLVRQTLRGSKKIHGRPVHQKRTLTMTEIRHISDYYYNRSSHDDLLFHIILLLGFFALMRLGELVSPDDRTFDNPRKITKRATLTLSAKSVQFTLPYHKADKFFDGNTILVNSNDSTTNPVRAMARYILSRDRQFPTSEEMWIRSNGEPPRRRWFLERLRSFYNDDVAGHSLRSGGATTLAAMGVSLPIIQAMGRWASDTFRSYIRLHPLLLHSAIQHHLR